MKPVFAPTESVEELISRGKNDVAAWHEFYARYEYSKDVFLARLAAPELRRMKLDPDATVDCLHASDRSLRIAALLLVYEYWINNPIFAPHCLSIAFADSDDVVRGLALLCVPRLYAHIDDRSGVLKSILRAVVPANDDEVQTEIKRAIGKCDSLLDECRRKLEESWKADAGDNLARMLSSVEDAKTFLRHSDPTLRRVALSVLAYHWKHEASAFSESEAIAADKGAPPDLRADAINVIALFRQSTNDRRIGGYLASIAMDAEDHPDVRLFAYVALYSIRGVPPVEQPLSPPRFPEDVDWDFVSSFLPRGERGSSGDATGF